MTVVNSAEWLQAALNAKKLEEVNRRIVDLEAALVGEVRQIRQELSALCRQVQDRRT